MPIEIHGKTSDSFANGVGVLLRLCTYGRDSDENGVCERSMRKAKLKRLEEQRQRQVEYRLEQKKRRRPGRDDVARIALHWLIVSMDKQTKMTGDASGQHRLENTIIQRLVGQGFDEKEAEDVLADLSEKYVRQGWDFQRKPHLNRIDDDENERD